MGIACFEIFITKKTKTDKKNPHIIGDGTSFYGSELARRVLAVRSPKGD